MLKQILDSFVIPITVAVLTYLIVDRWGEWRKRRTYSRLGVAILESLQEEVRRGIELMTETLAMVRNPADRNHPTGKLPHGSWSGMTTITDEVLIRILETSEGTRFGGFEPRDCRIHCKNYFEHMCLNYNRAQEGAIFLVTQGNEWRDQFRPFLIDGSYITSANQVNEMLEHARQLLEVNSRRRWRPR